MTFDLILFSILTCELLLITKDLIEDFSCYFWVKANIDRTMRAKNAIDKAKATSVKGL